MQTLTLSRHVRHVPGQLRDSKTPLQLRAFRFVSERYTQRERPSVAAEFFFFALITATALWAMYPLVLALGLHR